MLLYEGKVDSLGEGNDESVKLSGRNIVVWSGGADSTAVLNYYAGVSCADYPVVAVSVAGHVCLNQIQCKLQNEAQERYLKFARDKGFHIKHQKVRIDGSDGILPGYEDKRSCFMQPLLWLLYLMPYVGDDDTVHFGYIQGDGFWHIRREFEDVFDSISKMMMLKNVSISYPFEWGRKYQILEKLGNSKVPDNCWWSCDAPKKDGKKCGICTKCRDIVKAKSELRRSNDRKSKRLRRKKS